MTMTMSQLLRDNIVEEILCRLPAASLKRLRSTCKLWNGLFNNRRFTKKHFDKAAKQNLVLMLTEEYTISSLNVDLHEFKGYLGLQDPLYKDQFKISQVFHCDGLLLCNSTENFRCVVWNPCTGQTKWITHPLTFAMGSVTYTLGCYQDNKSHNKSYKVLRRYVNCQKNQIFEIYEINSDLWRIILEVTPDCKFMHTRSSVYLKGKTYWFALDEKELEPSLFLVSFDYTTERFARLCLPYPNGSYETASMSVVGEEKLSVLLRRMDTLEIEIWVSNPIDDLKVVSWSKIFVVDQPRFGHCIETSFLVDEEKKVALCCESWIWNQDLDKPYVLLYIVGEDNEVTQVAFGASSSGWHSHLPLLFNYVPSLIQF